MLPVHLSLVSYREAPLATGVATIGATPARWRRSRWNSRGSVASPWQGNRFYVVVTYQGSIIGLACNISVHVHSKVA